MNLPLPLPRTLFAFLLAGLAMFGPFSIDTIFPAFAVMGRDLGVGDVEMQQTISVYMLAYALTSVVHGPVSDARGRKPVILVGVFVFGLASIGCALSESFGSLLAFRALQGMSAGAGLIVGRAIIRDVFEGDDAQRLMSTITMIFGVAPAIAPIIGGWILGVAQWPAIFWFLALFALVLLIVVPWLLPETHPPAARTPLSPGTLWRNYRSILSNGQFHLLAGAACCNFGALFLYIASAPAFVMDLMGLNEQQFGWFFVPTIAGMVSGAFLMGRMAGRASAARTAQLGFAVSGVAAAINIGYNLWFAQPVAPWAVLPIALAAFGIALVFPILTLAMLDLFPRQRGGASSMQTFASLTFNALVAGVLSPLVSHSGLALALTSAALTLLAFVIWTVYRRSHRAPGAVSGREPAPEPTAVT